MSNSDRFLTAFNRIDRTLRDMVEAKEFTAFYRLMDLAAKKNSLVRKYEEDLRSYADLRNAIVHNQTSTDYVIAEPHVEVVEKIEQIDEALSKPKQVGALFLKQVLTFQMTDSLNDILNVIRQQKFTQFPVYDGNKFQGLVTTVGITNWVATSMEGAHFSKHIPLLKDLLPYEKNEQSYQFISSSMPIYEAVDIFKRVVGRGSRMEALLITEQGQKDQKLIGIVTPIDLMKVD